MREKDSLMRAGLDNRRQCSYCGEVGYFTEVELNGRPKCRHCGGGVEELRAKKAKTRKASKRLGKLAG